MADPIGAAIEEASKVVSAGIAAGLLGWIAFKRKSIANWHRQRKAHKAMQRSMWETWPTVVNSVADAPERAVRMTTQFQALTLQMQQMDSRLDTRMDAQDAALNEILAMNHGQFELSGQATFVCDNAGRNTLVNSAYARLLGVGRDDLMEFRYKRFIGSDDLAAYWPKFQSASDEHREFDSALWFTGNNGKRVHVCIRMVPHPRQQGPATHWVGTVTPCDEAQNVHQ